MVRFSFLLMLSILTLISCGDDDDSDPFTDTSLIGTWNITTYDVDLTVGIQGFPSETIVSTLISSDATVTFEADGSWTSMGESEFQVTEGDSTYTEAGSSVDDGTWTVAGQSVTIVSSDPDNSTFTVEDFMVTNFQANSQVALKSDVNESEVDPFFGLTITSTGTVDIVLEQ